MLAVAESWENGKPVRETLNADVPLVVDHFRNFAAAARAEENTSTEIDRDLVAYHFREPLGVVGQIIPFKLPTAHGRVEARARFAAGGYGSCTSLPPGQLRPAPSPDARPRHRRTPAVRKPRSAVSRPTGCVEH
jgi:aldehyde dehydrogenase